MDLKNGCSVRDVIAWAAVQSFGYFAYVWSVDDDDLVAVIPLSCSSFFEALEECDDIILGFYPGCDVLLQCRVCDMQFFAARRLFACDEDILSSRLSDYEYTSDYGAAFYYACDQGILSNWVYS